MKRILVIDDEPTICELIADTLRESGYHVDTATNGVVGLDVIRRHVPEAIVLDLMMPRLDARGFVERLRVEPQFAAIPILIVTAAYGAYEAAERLGARACLTKPFELEQLVEMIGQLLDEPSQLPSSSSAPTTRPRSIAAEV